MSERIGHVVEVAREAKEVIKSRWVTSFPILSYTSVSYVKPKPLVPRVRLDPKNGDGPPMGQANTICRRRGEGKQMEILLHGVIALPNKQNLKEQLISGSTEIKGSFPALVTGRKDSSGRIDPKT
ncbi:hypothetical protein DFH08DRAFT_810612 [Mycena albidolilacea]|uniref:Uncharacterized protein n=1 Tax=Mycena albidolilacea TaxID=1033008 RepID=A0AAD6ZYG8_9AGAR|nr:hypothetical protein DFH08DRAFT_810612 [Mycena albidolilacea]